MIPQMLIFGFISTVVGLLVGSFIVGAVDNAINCNNITSSAGKTACGSVKTIAWSVYGIIPVTLFFFLLHLFGMSPTG